MGRGLTILLFVSLAINVLVGGFVGGVFAERALSGPEPSIDEPRADGPPPGAPGAGLPGRGPRGFARDLALLSPESRQIFRRTFLENRLALREGRQGADKAREDFAIAMTADPWDRDVVAAALDAMATAESEAKRRQHETLLKALEQLPLEERQKLVEAQFQDRFQDRRPFRERRRRFRRN
ncbi:MAG: periplasmic heavy metal sensor [Pseudomonadota bacterium]